MSQLKKFNVEAIKNGNFSEIKQVIKESAINGKANDALFAIDAACINDQFRKEFTQAFKTEWDPNLKKLDFTLLPTELVEKNFAAFEERSKEADFDVTNTSVLPVIATTVLPTIERLIQSTEILRLVSSVNVGSANEYIQMYSYDQQLDAAILAEVAMGTDQDEVIRSGDRLTAEHKVQASTKLSELAISRMSAADYGVHMARLARRVQNTLCVAILRNGESVAANTAKNSIRGILNNFGTTGTGDATGHIGAIAYANKAAADTAIVAAGGVASTDAYDLCLKVKAFLLPSIIQDVDESDYVFIMSRNTWGAVSTVLDSTGRAKARTQVDAATGKVTKLIDNTRVMTVPANQVPTGRVYLVPPKFYKLAIYGALMNLNDGGVVQLREGLYSFVSRTWADGSMEYAHKYRPTTAITAGSTVPDNAEQNAFRVFNIT